MRKACCTRSTPQAPITSNPGPGSTAFIRSGTNPAILPAPMSIDEAVGQVEAWFGAPAAVVPSPPRDTPDSCEGSFAKAAPPGNLTADAHLAALAIEHGAEIVSYDRDFARFAGVRHRLPG